MEKEGCGVENVDHRRDRNREIIDGLRNHLFSAIHSECRERFLNPNLPAELFRNLPCKGGVGGDGFEATAIAAAASLPVRNDRDVPQLTRHATVPGEKVASAHDTKPQPRAHIEHRKIIHSPGRPIHALAHTKGMGFLQCDALQADFNGEIGGEPLSVQ